MWRRSLLSLVLCVAACYHEHDVSSERPSEMDMDARVGEDAAFHDARVHDAALDANALDANALDATPYDLRDAAEGEAGPSDASVHDAGPETFPVRLSETGLFDDFSRETLGPGVRAFEPKYKLWSDGASKRRWIYFPPGTQIDTSDMDHWVYPVGTKAWKEFTSGTTRVETRLLHKVAADQWLSVSYLWRSDLSDADAVPAGVANANGTQHDVPDSVTCMRCHGNVVDKLLGPSAIQLSHQLNGVTLQVLIDEGRLTSAPAQIFPLPGDTAAQAALGYLHANCGHCHNPRSEVFALLKKRSPYTGGPRFWENVGALASVVDSEGYRSTVGQPNSVLPELSIIEPGKSSKSELWVRIGQRGLGSLQMPPIATEVVDEAGMASIKLWIDSLPPRDADAGTADAATADAAAQDEDEDGPDAASDGK